MGEAAQEIDVASPAVQVVGDAFVLQYYRVLHHSPEHVHKFYHEESKIGRPKDDGATGITTTIEAIKEKILSLDYGEFRAEIKTVDAQESFGKGVLVLVTGYLTGKDEVTRNFTQAFFLAPQDNGGYFVLNDAFRYVEDVKSQDRDSIPVNEIEIPLTSSQNTPLQETTVLELDTVVEVETVEESREDVVSAKFPDAIPEEPVADIINDTNEVIKSDSNSVNTTKETQKMSYASIVKVAATLQSNAPTTAKNVSETVAKQVKVTAPPVAGADTPTLIKDAVENVNQQYEEVGRSIYIKALPMNATPAQVESEFKQFGSIKRDGVQVRSSKGFCYGFVEFEEASSAIKAIQASPIIIAGHEVFAQEKKSKNSQVNNKQPHPAGRGNGFRSDDVRGRGIDRSIRGGYGGRGFNSSENNGKGNYNRGSHNRYQRSDNSNNIHPQGVMANKPITPRNPMLS